jgi:exo-beta-1,3-glucanase (GH17 family)
MKGLTSILLLFILMTCRSQDKICFDCYSQEYVDSLVIYKDSIITEINTANTKLQTNLDGSFFIIDSLKLVVKNLEAAKFSDSLIANTFHFYLSDTVGNITEIWKAGADMQADLINGKERIQSIATTGYRRTYFMNDTASVGSMIEDETGIQTKTNYRK